jgi:RhtB (resistance to homoserine/threonine) family protein
MFGIINFEVFILTALILIFVPGSDAMYIIAKSIANGKKEGILASLGVSTGSLVHTAFAAFGLSVILAESQVAFNIVKYLGAAYLIYLGIKAIATKNSAEFVIKSESRNKKKGRTYISGVLTNVLNPKVALFYLAFLPQFVDPNYTYPYISFLVLGLIFTTAGILWSLVLAMFSSKLSKKFRENYRIKIWLDRITGVVFISLGAKLLFSKLK